MRVSMSRYTPGLTNAKGVGLVKGDKVKYRTRSGEEFEIIIDSELMSNHGFYGYECIFPDGRFFAVEDGIYDWEGKR